MSKDICQELPVIVRAQVVLQRVWMMKLTVLQDISLSWIRNLARGTTFSPQDLYSMLTQDYLDECQNRGDSDWEERYKNDTRWAIQIALDREGLITRVKRGSYRRL
jgi:hypothetical protein